MPMIKLVACDLDGTLLDPSGNLPENIFEVILRLYSKGILFCPASGRQLFALENLFAPVKDKILIIAENGAIVSRFGKIQYCDALTKDQIFAVLKAVKNMKRAHPLLCTPDCAYYEDDVHPFVDFVAASYLSNAKRELDLIADKETVCKIAVYDECGPENDGMKILPSLLPQLRIIQSGGNWLDVSSPLSNKGRAIRYLQQALSISPDECAAFGDHMNDLEMLLACTYAYTPENAYEGIKKIIPGRVASNADNGVLEALIKIADGKQP